MIMAKRRNYLTRTAMLLAGAGSPGWAIAAHAEQPPALLPALSGPLSYNPDPLHSISAAPASM